jgi:mono/diheme cytochrome c family protein
MSRRVRGHKGGRGVVDLVTVALALGPLVGCTTADIDPMERQPKVKPYAESTLFADGRAMRQPPAGTVPRERLLDGPEAKASALAAEEVTALPVPVTRALLERGRNRYDIYCATCHGLVGDGDSVVADKMSLRLPPSLHTQHARGLTEGALYRVITEGYGVMPSYRVELPLGDRWAVVAYVRALQRSQNARLADMPEAERKKLVPARPGESTVPAPEGPAVAPLPPPSGGGGTP